MWLTRFPPLAPGQIMCSNISLALDRHQYVVPGLALVPSSTSLIHWRIIRYAACEQFSSGSSVRLAYVERTVASSTKKTVLCAIGGLAEQNVAAIHAKSSPLNFTTMLGVFATFSAVIVTFVVHVISTKNIPFFK
jgi:hypothetical protein